MELLKTNLFIGDPHNKINAATMYYYQETRLSYNTRVIMIKTREKEKNVKLFLKKMLARLQFRSKSYAQQQQQQQQQQHAMQEIVFILKSQMKSNRKTSEI